ncbi:hypothetical protein [Streptomyces longwoodensis]|uniref:hypothetical protein n=1 Tax=Streptomyces longwoodensis TaxID=68231 RepID=UPI002255FC9A|nr:hypothetical protein [Streptomyces longwoodensis]MCX4994281.1 hypothetical protein [Streptomyces longwoodensis]
MANNQPALPTGEDEIIQQVQAYTLAGITRAMLRGCIDRGELRIADHNGSRGSARVYRADVLRLMEEKGWRAPAGKVPAQGAPGGQCVECARLREARQQDAETIRRLRRALAAATE